MLGLVLLVGIWDHLWPAFVGRRRVQEDAWTRNMMGDGAAVRSAGISFLVESMNVRESATKDYVAAARCRLTRDAFVAGFRNLSLALSARTRKKAIWMGIVGLDHSIVEQNVDDLMIVGNQIISARELAMPKPKN